MRAPAQDRHWIFLFSGLDIYRIVQKVHCYKTGQSSKKVASDAKCAVKPLIFKGVHLERCISYGKMWIGIKKENVRLPSYN